MLLKDDVIWSFLFWDGHRDSCLLCPRRQTGFLQVDNLTGWCWLLCCCYAQTKGRKNAVIRTVSATGRCCDVHWKRKGRNDRAPVCAHKVLERSPFARQSPLKVWRLDIGYREQEEPNGQEEVVVQSPVGAAHIRGLLCFSHMVLDDSFTLSLTVKNKDNDTFPVFMLKS